MRRRGAVLLTAVAILMVAPATAVGASIRPLALCARGCRITVLYTGPSHAQIHSLALGVASPAAASLASTCANADLTPTPEDLQAVRAATVCLINQARARNAISPLRPNPQLEEAAQAHSEQMVDQDYFAHITPHGETVLQRLEGVGYISAGSSYVVGENIAWGTLSLATPQAIVEAWMASPAHMANILEANFTDTGIGVDPAAPAAVAEGAPAATYTEDFGVVQDSSTTVEVAETKDLIAAQGSKREACRLHLMSRRQLIDAGDRTTISREGVVPADGRRWERSRHVRGACARSTDPAASTCARYGRDCCRRGVCLQDRRPLQGHRVRRPRGGRTRRARARPSRSRPDACLGSAASLTRSSAPRRLA